MDRADVERSPGAFCLFSSGARPMGVGLGFVAEVMQPDRIVRLPLCPRPVLGLCVARGGFVLVVGPPEVGGGGAGGVDGAGQTVMVLRSSRGIWGLAIDRTGVTVEDDLEPRAADGPSPEGSFVVDGVVDRAGVPHAILDPDRTWERLRAELDRWYRDVLGADPNGDLRSPSGDERSPRSRRAINRGACL